MSSCPKVFAIILNYNGFDYTKNCIKSFQKVKYQNLTLVIVDNSSTDDSYEKLKLEFPELIIIKTGYNSGYTGGMNFGAKYGLENGADYILLSNNDMLYEEDFLSILMDKIESDKNIGVISPKVLYMHDPQIIYCAGAEFKFSHCGSVNLHQGKPTNEFGNEPKEITNAEGSCLLLRREVFEKAGFYDERLFMYFEDLDLSDRVRKFFKIFYEPKSIVYHKAGSGLSWKDFSPLYYYYYTRNRLIYFSRFNVILKFYAIVFTISNSLAKNAILLKEFLLSKDNKQRTKKSIQSLWDGTFTGLKIIFGFINIEDKKLFIGHNIYRFKS